MRVDRFTEGEKSGFLWLGDSGESDLFRITLLLLDITSYLQQSIEHLSTLATPRRQLRIRLLIGLLHSM